MVDNAGFPSESAAMTRHVDLNKPSKRHWRRTISNRVTERLAVARSDAVVIYLPGPEDLERPIFLDRGFRGENLIGIERDPKVVEKLRGRGVNVIHGDVWDVLPNWNQRRRVDVVALDFFGGLTEETARGLINLASHGAFQEAVFAVNMLRGREEWLSAARQEVGLVPESKHRGETLYRCFIGALAANFFAKTAVDFDTFQEMWASRMRPWMGSYKSASSNGHQVFDSAVYAGPFRGLPPAQGWGLFGTKGRLHQVFRRGQWVPAKSRSPARVLLAKRSTAAALAHQTMKLKSLARI